MRQWTPHLLFFWMSGLWMMTGSSISSSSAMSRTSSVALCLSRADSTISCKNLSRTSFSSSSVPPGTCRAKCCWTSSQVRASNTKLGHPNVRKPFKLCWLHLTLSEQQHKRQIRKEEENVTGTNDVPAISTETLKAKLFSESVMPRRMLRESNKSTRSRTFTRSIEQHQKPKLFHFQRNSASFCGTPFQFLVHPCSFLVKILLCLAKVHCAHFYIGDPTAV